MCSTIVVNAAPTGANGAVMLAPPEE
jgi:hypothetical protein